VAFKVSVVIPTYNRADLIGQTLDSVFGQTRRADQVVVVDDGSEDDTRRVLEEWEPRILYRRIRHAGASAARNAGLEIARGAYVAFLDSDDLWETRFLERMVAVLDSAPAAGFAYCDYATFDGRGIVRRAYLPPRHKLRGSLFTRLLETDFLSTGTLLIRRECLEHTGGFDPSLEITHDWDLWLRLAHAYDAEYVDEPLVHIRTDSAGLTRNTPLLYANNLRVLAKIRRRVTGGEQLALVRLNVSACHRALFKHYWSAGRPGPALAHFGHSLSARFL
jgi:glycosyltransferase involved in cell wall biosynthesis